MTPEEERRIIERRVKLFLDWFFIVFATMTVLSMAVAMIFGGP